MRIIQMKGTSLHFFSYTGTFSVIYKRADFRHVSLGREMEAIVVESIKSSQFLPEESRASSANEQPSLFTINLQSFLAMNICK